MRIPGIILAFFICTLFHSCKKEPVPPTLTTNEVSEISTISAVAGGNITSDGGSSITDQGICWHTSPTPTIKNSKASGLENNPFNASLTDLKPNTVYYVRAFATNVAGISYGNQVQFRTLGKTPVANISEASVIQTNSAFLNGSVNPNLLSTTITFEYGLTVNYGSYINAIQNPLSDLNVTTNVSAELTGLGPGTTYHFRLKAENSLGIAYSQDATFKTLGNVPDIMADNISEVTMNSANLSATINPNYLPTAVTIEYGETINYGNSVIITNVPLTGSSALNINKNLSGLNQLTIYHYRFVATNQLGTTTSPDKTFSTFGIVSDVDGNTYKTVRIGSQVWMAENLRTTHFPDGVPIFNGEDVANFCDAKPYYFRYNKDPNLTEKHGLLYNYYAATKSTTLEPDYSNTVPGQIHGACPTGWHLPSFAEYIILIDHLGGEEVAGGKLKTIELWKTPNKGATNSSGFSALPSGAYDKLNYGYNYMGAMTIFWSSSGRYDYFSVLYLEYSKEGAPKNYANHRCNGTSIRCIRD